MNPVLTRIASAFRLKEMPHSHSEASVCLRGVSVRYENKPALDSIDLSIHLGERVAIIGPNGAGKSTLFKLIVGLIRPNEGTVSIFGNDPGGHICIGYVPQRNEVDWNFPVTVYDVVMMGRCGRIGLMKKPSGHDRQVVNEALELVGLDGLSGRQISELSGGQQQRVFLARSFAQEAELMLMDEPFTGLDNATRNDILKVLDLFREKGITVLVSLHNLKIAADYFPRIVLLHRKIVADGTATEVLTPELLVRVYGQTPLKILLGKEPS